MRHDAEKEAAGWVPGGRGDLLRTRQGGGVRDAGLPWLAQRIVTALLWPPRASRRISWFPR